MKDQLSLESRSENTFWRHTFGPLFLITVCPITVFLFWYTNTVLEGSFEKLFALFKEQGVLTTIFNVFSPYFFGSTLAWKIIACFAIFELALMRWLPGKLFMGPLTPHGNIPVYKANGVAAFLTTLAAFYLGAYRLHFFSPSIVYDNFPGILGALNFFSLLFCLFLYFKGKYAPSSTDASSTGNVIFDYYWGTELYPRLAGWDVKMFTNCRFGMMSWGLIILSFAAKQQELHGLSNSMLIAVALQLLYITKFFFWETGYLRSLDIMHDRAGYYICWGCLVWVPGIYTSSTLYLVNHPNQLGTVAALFIFTAGASCILINFLADRQRQRIRATAGTCKIWGKEPKLTMANYVTENGESQKNVLLASGWWGVARHFHYVPEILGTLFWTLPALFDNFSPYFYVIFLTILLLDRSSRDEQRCALKYGQDWDLHCKKVPYKLLPFVH